MENAINNQEIPLHGSKWFDIVEFVDRRTWQALGFKAACLIDPRIVRVCDMIREKAGAPVTVNNWFQRNGKFDSSGYRAVWDSTGGSLSQHRRGCAADVKVLGLKPKQVFELIMDNQIEFEVCGLTTMENLKFTPTWIHVDVRPRVDGWHPKTGFLIVDP